MFDFGKSLVFIDVAFDTAEQVIRFGADELYKTGYVKESYGASVAERERDFPTGLPTEPYGIAIPHTNSSINRLNMVSSGKPSGSAAPGRQAAR